MNTLEIETYLKQNSTEIIKTQSLEMLYEIFIELAIRKSEIHKLIHFCVDDYERKNYYLLMSLANSQQTICETKIKNLIHQKSENLKLDFEIEKEYILNELKKHRSEAILFKQFCKKILPKKQFSQIDTLSKNCSTLNMSVADYISEKMFNHIDFNDGNEDIA